MQLVLDYHVASTPVPRSWYSSTSCEGQTEVLGACWHEKYPNGARVLMMCPEDWHYAMNNADIRSEINKGIGKVGYDYTKATRRSLRWAKVYYKSLDIMNATSDTRS